jgi:hypothetical protein
MEKKTQEYSETYKGQMLKHLTLGFLCGGERPEIFPNIANTRRSFTARYETQPAHYAKPESSQIDNPSVRISARDNFDLGRILSGKCTAFFTKERIWLTAFPSQNCQAH